MRVSVKEELEAVRAEHKLKQQCAPVICRAGRVPPKVLEKKVLAQSGFDKEAVMDTAVRPFDVDPDFRRSATSEHRAILYETDPHAAACRAHGCSDPRHAATYNEHV